ncbi:MAG: NAD-glutamate dehydrogenase [Streptosporangiales bacterium]|nr:NAD-glutamate dehydrogenase [Streptosporangiales bacterium]MBO0890148.1 NAD-glutamate dehydrogenase [Acidothermales bacterium]
MHDKLDDAKDDIIERAAEIGLRSSGGHESPEALRRLLRLYYQHVPAEDLLARDPVDVFGAAVAHRRLARTRPEGRTLVRAYTPTQDSNGWECGHTVVEIVTEDMPFLVDSARMELQRQDLTLHLVVHPQVWVRRNLQGELLEVCDVAGPDAAPDDAVLESWMHLEVDRQDDEQALQRLQADMTRVLTDVRESVEDWQRMQRTMLGLADEIENDVPEPVRDQAPSGVELMRWLADDHFTFLGYREYELVNAEGEDALVGVAGTGLGILRADRPASKSFAKLPPEVRAQARKPRLLFITKANSRSTVHRPSYLDYIGVKKFDADGNVVGERRFLGLLTHQAYSESITRIPVLKEKYRQILTRAALAPNSHDGKNLLEILENYPRDELFQAEVEDLLPTVLGVLNLRERRRLKLFLRRDDYGRFMSCLVYLPRDRYTTPVRLRIQEILQQTFDGGVVDYSASVGESLLARLQVVVRAKPGSTIAMVDPEPVERRLVEAIRTWDEDLADAIRRECGESAANKLIAVYRDAFPEAYKEDFPARTAVADLRRLETLESDDSIALNLYEPYDAEPGERRLKVFRGGGAMSLSAALPLLQSLGVEVVDERPYLVERNGKPAAWIYDFGLRYTATDDVDPARVKELFQEAFFGLWRGEVENDRFNALVTLGGLDWREITVLRAYAKYMRQAETPFSSNYIEACVVGNVAIARLLVQLFEARHDPRLGGDRETRIKELTDRVTEAIDKVSSLDEDRILRSYLTMIQATLRTSYYQEGADGRPQPYLVLKFDSPRIEELPKPRPAFEVFVYSPRFEGVHLRFGKVARGGLRWSDRREDFRTEILGLVKAQMVKNSVIVPVGAKGGFVLKRPPTDPADRDAFQAEGVTCYRMFISALLDITDNRVDGDVVAPDDVVRHDDDDTYLVVAADKGTATFSDIANEIAVRRGFWLGDAFASGGSTGYDHKAMGITARGAWESVRYHFRKLGVDTQSQDFTVVGVGDMSGDVFGNGMLLSEHIRLVAAFDHRHVFLDPDPDPATSYAERRRLFELPRSSWADYDTSLVSAGGGVHPRAAKSIPVSEQVRAALGIHEPVTKLTPQELIRAIVKAPVDLFWNGGIGTYVKASTETNAAVGDKANDAVRVDGQDLRCKVVGEGGNLGLTQLGRIEYALNGGLVNTDFIDNTAGVDTSDHEVNIKILLDQVVRAGDLTEKQRNELLESMSDDVARLVLRDNYEQNVVLGASVKQNAQMLHVHARYLRRLERAGLLDRRIEFLPSAKQLSERRSAGTGLTSPELATVLAYTKIVLTADLLESDLPEDPYLRNEVYTYFPAALRERFGDAMDSHPLRREIIATCVVNNMVNRSGTTGVFRFQEETSASVADISRAYAVARAVFGMPEFWDEVERLDNVVPVDVQLQMLLEARKLTERATRWLLHYRRPPFDIESTIEAYREGVQAIVPHLPKLLVGSDLRSYESRHDGLVEQGVPDALAERVAGLVPALSVLDIVDVATSEEIPVEEVAEVYFDLADRLSIAALREKVIGLPRNDRWHTMARNSLRDDLYEAHKELARGVLTSTDGDLTPEDRLRAWADRNATAVTRAAQQFTEIWDGDVFDMATLSVAVRAVRTLVATSALPHNGVPAAH